MATRSIIAVTMAWMASAAAAQSTSRRPEGAREQRSYALGLELGRQLRDNLVDVDPALVSQGLQEALRGADPLLSDEEVRAAVADLQADMKRRVATARGTGAEENRRAGQAFLAENRSRPGVITLPSGLQYRIVRTGDGPRPTRDDTVLCRYRGTLVSGVEFDSSSHRAEGVALPVAGVIPGWSEALQLMPVGSRWQLFIPPELAYGTGGAGVLVGPNATLIFDVELIAIQGAAGRERTATAGRPAATE